MENFKNRGRELRAWTDTGAVLKASKHSETSVNSYGGGGYVGQHGGHVQAPTVVSTSSTKHEIWIKKDDGAEKAVKLANVDIPLREGQRVTFIGVCEPGADEGWFVGVVNHAAKQHWYINRAKELNQLTGVCGGSSTKLVDWALVATYYILLFFAASDRNHGLDRFLAAMHLDFGGFYAFMVLGPIGYIVLRAIVRANVNGSAHRRLDAWIERTCQSAYQK